MRENETMTKSLRIVKIVCVTLLLFITILLTDIPQSIQLDDLQTLFKEIQQFGLEHITVALLIIFFLVATLVSISLFVNNKADDALEKKYNVLANDVKVKSTEIKKSIQELATSIAQNDEALKDETQTLKGLRALLKERAERYIITCRLHLTEMKHLKGNTNYELYGIAQQVITTTDQELKDLLDECHKK